MRVHYVPITKFIHKCKSYWYVLDIIDGWKQKRIYRARINWIRTLLTTTSWMTCSFFVLLNKMMLYHLSHESSIAKASEPRLLFSGYWYLSRKWYTYIPTHIGPTQLVLLDVKSSPVLWTGVGNRLHMIKCCLPHPGVEPRVSRLLVVHHTPRPMRHLICSALHLPQVQGMFRLWIFLQDWSCRLCHVMSWGS